MLGDSWGETASERAMALPCDDVLTGPTTRLHRAIDVAASAERTFPWLCQLRAAPYSYDLLDNLGRRSPRTLDPTLQDLHPGQRFMAMFTLDSFERDLQITLRWRARVAMTYALLAQDPDRCRLLVRVCMVVPNGTLGRFAYRRAFPAGDLVMMRKQLRTLADLAAGGVAPTHRA